MHRDTNLPALPALTADLGQGLFRPEGWFH